MSVDRANANVESETERSGEVRDANGGQADEVLSRIEQGVSTRQEQLCTKPVESQLSLLLLGTARDTEDTPQAFCALAWSGQADKPENLEFFLRLRWQAGLPENQVSYITDLLDDWKQLALESPSVLIKIADQLCVGPIRTIMQASLPKEQALEAIRQALGDSETTAA